MSHGGGTDATDVTKHSQRDVRNSRNTGAHSDQPNHVDWAWRRHIRSRRNVHLAYRMVVGLVGGAVTVLGLVLIPAPGPGWLVVFLGLAILASEFEWAARLLGYAKHQVGRWTDWATSRPLPIRVLLGLATLVILASLLWLTLRVSGVPGFVPDSWVPAWSGLQG
jgi:uncharacterized protein (TIGR02611 family)